MLNSLSARGLQAALGNAAPVSDTPSRAAQAAPDPSAGKTSPPVAAPHRSVVEKAVDTLNHNTQFSAQGLRFSIDEESGKTVVKIVDTETQDVLRQFPSEDALALAHSIDKMQGLLLREKA